MVKVGNGEGRKLRGEECRYMQEIDWKVRRISIGNRSEGADETRLNRCG